MTRTVGRIAAAAAFLLAQVAVAGAAEIKVFSTVGVKSVLEELAPKFEKATGHKLTITWSTAALLAKRVQAGEKADALILIKGNVETLLKGRQDRARHRYLVCKIDLRRRREGRRAEAGYLHARRAQEQPAGGESGQLLRSGHRRRQRGLYRQADRAHGHYRADERQDQAPAVGRHVGNSAGQRRRRHRHQFKPELLSVAGVEVVGPLPGDMAFTVVYAAGVGAARRRPMRPKRWSNF